MNQYSSPKGTILALLSNARMYLSMAAEKVNGEPRHEFDRMRLATWARTDVDYARRLIDSAPASTRRRWKAGR